MRTFEALRPASQAGFRELVMLSNTENLPLLGLSVLPPRRVSPAVQCCEPHTGRGACWGSRGTADPERTIPRGSAHRAGRGAPSSPRSAHVGPLGQDTPGCRRRVGQAWPRAAEQKAGGGGQAAMNRLHPGSTVACGCCSEGRPCVTRPFWVAFTLLCANRARRGLRWAHRGLHRAGRGLRRARRTLCRLFPDALLRLC